jgi:hypothetical protein
VDGLPLRFGFCGGGCEVDAILTRERNRPEIVEDIVMHIA